jgi:hypothetical protein
MEKAEILLLYGAEPWLPMAENIRPFGSTG